jgi:hypothetical protein
MTVAAIGLLVALIVASVLGPTPHPAHTSRPRRGGSTRSAPTPTAPRAARPISLSLLAGARSVAARFLTGYLPFLYGRASARSIEGVTTAFRLRLSRRPALVTPVERRRRPRVVSLTAVGLMHGQVLATVLVSDGGVTAYALRITLRAGPDGLSVSGVDGR